MTKYKITCPLCGKDKTWKTDNPHRPFCSERCKLIDLGEWASDQYSIPGSPIGQQKLTDKNDQ